MHRVAYLLSEGFQLVALATQTVFELANVVAGEPFYALATHAPDGGEVRSSSGLAVCARPLTPRTQADTWMVLGVNDPLQAAPPEAVLRFLRRQGNQARRMAGVCTGGFVLAAAGLLEGRRATTHWAYAQEMQRRYPGIQVEDDRIYIVDGPVWTSAGMTAGLDLALAMVEKDLGEPVARSVAHRLVMNQRRSGGQSQHSEMLALAPKSDRVQAALAHARAHLNQPLSVEDLASVAHLSPRQFSRVFTQETGLSPAKAVEGLRVEAARLMIEQSRHALDEVARHTGFRDRRHLREVFLRHLGVAPQVVRRGARQPGAPA